MESGLIMENLEAEIFNLIVHSGNARGLIFEALDVAEKEDYSGATKLMQEANEELVLAHNVQTQLIQDELKNKSTISLLLIHAQDQFMTTMSEQVLIEKMIHMQKQLNELK